MLFIPLLASGVAFYKTQVNRSSIIYESSAKIFLGSFSQNSFSSVEYMGVYLNSDKFLSEVIEKKLKNTDIKTIKSKLIVLPKDRLTIELKFTDSDKETANSTMNAILSEAMEQSDQDFNKRVSSLDEEINKINQLQLNDLKDKVEAVDTVSKLEREKSDLIKSEVLEGTVTNAVPIPSQLKTILFALIMGIFVDLVIVSLPEMLKRK